MEFINFSFAFDRHEPGIERWRYNGDVRRDGMHVNLCHQPQHTVHMHLR